ncbi:MAG: bacterial Ig-like domain-containing protein [Paludibacteraceae bacterium]|nr:bacterial Ig-like domain-containing protein [Paludibacteraceae bacterium]
MKTKFFKRVLWLMIPLLTIFTTNVWGDETFTRVTALSQLSDGDVVILVSNTANGSSGKAMSTTQNTNNRGATAVSISSSGTITLSSGHSVQLLTLKINASGQYGFHTGSGYLAKPNNNNNYLTTNSVAASTAPSGLYAWTPTLPSSGNTNKYIKLRNVTKTSYYLQYNNGGSGLFSTYGNTQGNPCIFKKTQSCTLSSISLNTSGATTTFCVGETFNSTGLVTTAKYSGGCSDATVTPTSISSPNMASAGTKTVTVTYTEGGVTKTATYDITVNAKYTVTWLVNGSSYAGGTTQVCPGTHVTSLPTAPNPASYCGDVFVGWTDEEYSGDSAPTHLYKTASEFPNATDNQTFYAVFADYKN